MALVSTGLGLGSTTTAPLARWIITNYDWRTAMLVYFWLFIASGGIGLGAVAIALAFRPPRPLGVALPSPS